MATIALLTVHRDFSRRKKKLTIQGTIAGAYVNGTPIVVDLTAVTNPKLFSGGKPAANPTRGIILNNPAGYSAKLIQGATLQTWGLRLYSAPGVELASGAVPAALIADPFMFEFEGSQGNF